MTPRLRPGQARLLLDLTDWDGAAFLAAMRALTGTLEPGEREDETEACRAALGDLVGHVVTLVGQAEECGLTDLRLLVIEGGTMRERESA